MPTARTIVAPLFAATFGLCIAAGCGGDPKPGAKSPEGEAAKKDGPKKDEPKAVTDAKEPGPAADGGEKVKVVDGKAPGGDDRYALEIPAVEATMGEKAEVVVRVVPKAPWHMNLDFPTSLSLTPPDGVAVANASLKKGDARKLDESACEFAVELTPSAAGDHAITGKFKFAVCQDEACSPVTEDVTLKVAVK